MLKSVFMGTPPFVIPSLTSLYNHSNLSLIITGTDKHTGRGRKTIIEPEPKKFAIEHNIPLLQIERINTGDILKILKEINPDIILLVAFGFIIPEPIFNLPTYGTINIHASLLPKYRGASPIHQAILNRDKITGVTFQRINKILDSGAILYQRNIEILSDDDYLSLNEKLSKLSGEATVDFLDKLEKKLLSPIEQDEKSVSYCRKITKEESFFNWDDDKEVILSKIKAFIHWPIASVKTKFGILKVYKANAGTETTEKYGTVVSADKNGFSVSCKNGTIFLTEIQPENSKVMDYKSFLNGHRIKKGDVL